jgi:hypothetical protein
MAERVVMLAGNDYLGIVPTHPIRQLSGTIIPKRAEPDRLHPFSRHYPFFLASVENLFAADP